SNIVTENSNLAPASDEARISNKSGAHASASAQRFSRSIALTFAARLLMTANSVVAGIIVARWLGAEGLGQLAVINVAVATVVQLASLGLPSANTYFIAQDNRELRAVAINSFVFALLGGSLLAVSLTLLASARPDWFASISPRLIGVAAVSIPFQLITLIGLNVFLAVGRIEKFNLLDLTAQAFVLVNAVVALIILNSGLSTLVSLNTATAVVIGLVIIGLVWSYGSKLNNGLPWRPDRRLFVRMMRYGIKFHISILAGALIVRADLLVVNHYRGPSEAGVYSVASQVALMLMLLPGVIGTLLFPRAAAEQDPRGATTCRVSRHAVFIMFFVCLAAIPPSLILPLLYGPAFSEVPAQLLILLPGVFLIGLESVLVQHANAMGLPRNIPLFWIATLLSNIILVFVLVPRYGAVGAAVASTISYALIFLLVAAHFHSTTGRSFSEMFLLRNFELKQLFTVSRSAGAVR
ncbi:MAG: flippase, partial [Acidobacteriota bacterium]|nr:flippase [Acidobacteriota bacterium]